MNLRAKLELLMQNKDITRAELARATQIPYTTLDGILKRDKFDNVKFDTLEKLCTFFDVDLRYLIKDSINDPNYGKAEHLPNVFNNMTPAEAETIKKYRALDEHGKKMWLDVLYQINTKKTTDQLLAELNHKDTPDSESAASGAEMSMYLKQLESVLVKKGYIREGADISEQDANFLIALLDLIDAHFQN